MGIVDLYYRLKPFHGVA